MLNAGEVVVSENKVFGLLILGLKQLVKVQRLFLTKVIEDRLTVGWCSIKRTFEWLGGSVVVFHVV